MITLKIYEETIQDKLESYISSNAISINALLSRHCLRNAFEQKKKGKTLASNSSMKRINDLK